MDCAYDYIVKMNFGKKTIVSREAVLMEMILLVRPVAVVLTLAVLTLLPTGLFLTIIITLKIILLRNYIIQT